MPHFAKPFFKAGHKCWYVEIAGRQIRLGKDEEQAFRAYHALMKDKADGKLVIQTAKPDGSSVVDVLDRFLDSCQKESSPRNYEVYRDRLSSFAKHLKKTKKLGILVSNLRPILVLDWLDSHPNWAPGMRRGAIQAVQRAFNWATEVGLVNSSPVARMRKPAQGRRERTLTENEFAELLTNVHDGPFKELLLFAWNTGCRPQELVRIEARHCDLAASRIVIPPGEAKGKKRTRVIYLTPTAIAIVRPIVLKHPAGPIFRTLRGTAWSHTSVNNAFCRLQIACGMKKLKELGVEPTDKEIAAFVPQLKPTVRDGRLTRPKSDGELRMEARRKLTYKLAKKHAPKLCAYVLRHSFSTNALLRGVDPLTVSHLLGHANGAMLARVYSHLSQHPDHLLKAATKATMEEARTTLEFPGSQASGSVA